MSFEQPSLESEHSFFTWSWSSIALNLKILCILKVSNPLRTCFWIKYQMFSESCNVLKSDNMPG